MNDIADSASSQALSSATVAAFSPNGPCRIAAYFLDNTANSATTFFQFFDAAAIGDVTLGTTLPKFSLGVPGGASANLAFVKMPNFKKGICIAQTTTLAGNTGPSSNCTVTIWFCYKQG